MVASFVQSFYSIHIFYLRCWLVVMFQFGSFSGLCFAGLRESMRQAELNNWSLEPTQIADLCSSINQFFARTGVIQQQGPVQPPVCHGPMHPNKPSQHLNTGETPLHRPVPKNARFKMRSIVLPRSYRCRKLQLLVETSACLSLTPSVQPVCRRLLTGFLVSHVQEICTLTPDRACP